MKKIVAIMALLVGLGGVGFGVFQAVSDVDEPNLFATSYMAGNARTNFNLNASTTENVYQQTVVATWGTMDMVEAAATELAILNSRLSVLSAQQAQTNIIMASLLGLLGFAVLIFGLSSLSSRRESEKSDPPDTLDLKVEKASESATG